MHIFLNQHFHRVSRVFKDELRRHEGMKMSVIKNIISYSF